MQETRVRSLVWEDPLEMDMANYSSILTWKISWTQEPGGLPFLGSQRVGHNWVTNTYLLINLFFVTCLEKFLYHLLNCWFGGDEFSQLLFVPTIFILPSFLKNIFIGCKILRWQLFSFITLKMSYHEKQVLEFCVTQPASPYVAIPCPNPGLLQGLSASLW